MEETQNLNLNCKYLLEQLFIARKEIHNLRQQIKSLRYLHQREVVNIKEILLSRTTTSNASQPSTSNSIQDDSLMCQPIGVISTWFPNKKATPRQATVCEKAPGKITLFKSVLTNPHHALEGLEAFSHVWILFHFHKNDVGHIRAKVAPPRLNGSKTGVFSTRSPHRPCPIGLSLVKLVNIEENIIYFEGVDMVDQTPVLDIKPYVPHYDNPMYVEKATCAPTNQEIKNADAITLPIKLPSSSTSLPIADILDDEQLALRLAAEEFQENFQDIDNENPIITSTSLDTTDLLDNQNVDPRHSRFLDGADGPNMVCGADLVSINRRTCNLRIDDSSSSCSPVRMGVREAPDGEEGFDSSQFNNIQTTSNALENASVSNLDVQVSAASQDNNVRVPNWISQPRTPTLSVVFNERSIQQLDEILNGKADEKKQAIENVLREDPRSVYLRQRHGNQFYTFLIHNLHITCRFDDEKKIVTIFQIRQAGRMCACGQPEWQCSGHSPPSSFD